MPTTVAVLDRHQVQRLAVAPVAVRLGRHALLVAEHPPPQLERGVDLGLIAGPPNDHAQPAYRSMSSTSFSSLG